MLRSFVLSAVILALCVVSANAQLKFITLSAYLDAACGTSVQTNMSLPVLSLNGQCSTLPGQTFSIISTCSSSSMLYKLWQNYNNCPNNIIPDGGFMINNGKPGACSPMTLISPQGNFSLYGIYQCPSSILPEEEIDAQELTTLVEQASFNAFALANHEKGSPHHIKVAYEMDRQRRTDDLVKSGTPRHIADAERLLPPHLRLGLNRPANLPKVSPQDLQERETFLAKKKRHLPRHSQNQIA